MEQSKLAIYKAKLAAVTKLEGEVRVLFDNPNKPNLILLSFGGDIDNGIEIDARLDNHISTIALCEYLTTAIYNRSANILLDTIRLAKADVEVAKQEAREEAEMVLEQTK